MSKSGGWLHTEWAVLSYSSSLALWEEKNK